MNLSALAHSLAPPFAFCGIGLIQRGQAAAYHIGTAPGIRADENSLFRAASISKIVTARVLTEVVKVRFGQDPAQLDRNLAELLGTAWFHPAFPQTPITLRMLLSHTSSLDDAAGYLIPPGTTLPDWVAAQGALLFLPHRPGSCFSYSNLGYILLAAAAEALSGDRFDILAQQRVLGPLGITSGFNWSGVATADRGGRLATYRRDGADLLAQIDGPGPLLTAPEPYRPTLDTGALSPQGGLRISLTGALRLARSLADADPTPLWTPAMGPGDDLDGLFDSYGAGLQIFDEPSFYPRALIGHFANAYGFTGGVWWDAQRQAAFCYALNGLPLGNEDDALRPEELAIFAAIASAIGPA